MLVLKLLGGVSLSGPAGPVTGRAAQRRRLALLSVLAAARGAPVSRDKLVAYLWAESDTDGARHLLRDSLYVLRSALGEHVVVTAGDGVRVDPAHLASDVDAFERSLESGDPEQAVAHYAGPFLDGFHLSDAPEFERWVDDERSRLAARYASALEALAESAERDGAPAVAVMWWRRLSAHDPYSSRLALRLMRALAAAGDPAGALRHARDHETRLRRDLESVPDPAVTAFVTTLRATTAPPGSPTSTVSAAPVVHVASSTPPPMMAPPAPSPPAPSAPAPRRWTARRTMRVATVVSALVIALGALASVGATRVREASARERHRATAGRLAAEGYRAHFNMKYATARDRYLAATREDSTNPALWYGLMRAQLALVDTSWRGSYRRVMRIPSHATAAEARDAEHVRWRAIAMVTNIYEAPLRLGTVRAFYLRYPDDDLATLLYAEALVGEGAFLAAVPLFRRTITLGASEIDAGVLDCHGAIAYRGLQNAYTLADSQSAAEATVREWVARQPRSAAPLEYLGYVNAHAGHAEAAIAAARAAAALQASPDNPTASAMSPTTIAEIYLQANRSAESNALMAPLVDIGTFGARYEALWELIVGLRAQRRLPEALAAARELRRRAAAAPRTPNTRPLQEAYVEAQVLLESGRPRNRRLHHYVRGLLWAARGDHARAIDAYRRAVYSRNLGYTRVNLAMARSLVALGRYDEAADWLRVALRGSVAANNYYVARVDVYGALADVYRASGHVDLARDAEAHVRELTSRVASAP